MHKYEFNKFTARFGHACEMPVIAVDEEGFGLPIASLTSIKLAVQNDDGSYIEKEALSATGFGVMERYILYVFAFTAEEVDFFKEGENRSVFLKLTAGAVHQTYEFKNYLTVLPDLYTP